jgi:glycosyltransferase involved in cell wall biosynthesis
VASEIAGYRNVVSHDANGLLVPPRDTTAIVDAVVRILKDRSLAERLTLSGRHTAEQYRWERVASQVEDYYRQCIEEVGHFGGSK